MSKSTKESRRSTPDRTDRQAGKVCGGLPLFDPYELWFDAGFSPATRKLTGEARAAIQALQDDSKALAAIESVIAACVAIVNENAPIAITKGRSRRGIPHTGSKKPYARKIFRQYRGKKSHEEMAAMANLAEQTMRKYASEFRKKEEELKAVKFLMLDPPEA